MSDVMSRREMMGKVVPAMAMTGAMAACATAMTADAAAQGGVAAAFADAFKGGKYVLPPLPYAYDALEPHIDAETMKLHHDKHHQAYVDGLNKTLKSLTDLRAAGGEINVSVLTGLQEDLSFNASGHVLHTVFWSVMGKDQGGDPKDAVAEAITKSFGSIEAFKAQFGKAAAGVKGSGWAVLAYEPLGDQLIVLQVKQHDLQMVPGVTPLLPLDVWEHAYYLKYHSARPDYIKAWWNVANWPAVNDAFVTARKASGRAG